jgi:hypothetical protein
VSPAASRARGSRDALFVAAHLVEPTRNTRSVVLLLTDGSDTSSWMSASQIEAAMGRAGVVIHGIELDTRPAQPISTSNLAPPVISSASPMLRQAVGASGGRVWSAASDRELRRLFLEVLQELRDRYLVSYMPPEPVTAGWHKVDVRLDDARGDVLARTGYWVTPQK